jgi:N-acetyl-anhydromuramyl-L-alanine amidase AmpD
MQFDRSLRLPEGEFYHGPVRKDLIVLHHTAGGSAESTFTWWKTDPRRIATAYLVERDGTICEVFPPEAWACHLGVKGAGKQMDRRSIGIELASEGGLLERGGRFYAFDRLTEKTAYAGEVYDHGSRWRKQYRYFAAYTARQIEAVCALVNHLCERFAIPQQTPRSHTAADAQRWRDFSGILSHSHLRADKTDVHPGFPWARLIEQCGLQRTG